MLSLIWQMASIKERMKALEEQQRQQQEEHSRAPGKPAVRKLDIPANMQNLSFGPPPPGAKGIPMPGLVFAAPTGPQPGL